MSIYLLITGAAGFIGAATAKKALDQGYRVLGIDNFNPYYDTHLKRARLDSIKNNPNFIFKEIDITDKIALEKLWADHGPFTKVIHLAAQPGVRYSIENPYEYVRTNVMGHLTILEMCRHTNNFEHLVYASSSSVYGANAKLPFSTTDAVETPISLYAATKRSDELMSYTYAHLYQIPQTGLRFFTVYGPWGRPDMAPFIFARAILAGEKLPVFNNGNMRRDFTFIDDIVFGILGALDRPPPHDEVSPPHRVLNIGNSRSEKLLDFIAEIESALGRKANLEFLPMQPGDVQETYADISETSALTGFSPSTPIHEGVPKFIEWYKNYYADEMTLRNKESHLSRTRSRS